MNLGLTLNCTVKVLGCISFSLIVAEKLKDWTKLAFIAHLALKIL